MKTLATLTIAVALLVTCGASHAADPAEGPKADATIAALFAAAKSGDVAAITRLVAAGAKVDAKDANGVTTMFVAAVYGRTEAVALLLGKGADIKVTDRDGSTALHAAAFFCRTKTVELLLSKGAAINARNVRSETPLDTVAGPWSDELATLYLYLGAAIEEQMDLKNIRAARPKIAAILRTRGGKTGSKGEPVKEVAALGLRCSYYVDGEIHVNMLGAPEGKPLTSRHADFKPSWSKTDDMLVFFRRVKNDPVVTNWKTAICVINVDGTGFHKLTDGTHTDFNQTWTRDGNNTPIWNRRNRKTGGFFVMRSKVGSRPGQEVAITDKRHHTWAYTCLTDGRILVQSAHPKHGWGYFLMTPDADGHPRYERIDSELAKKGLLDRVSVSPSEKKVCFEYQTGFKYKDTGRTLYVADFDATKRTITKAKPIANKEAKPHWYAYPRWTKGEAAIVYHANKTGKGALYLYTLADGSTKRVSTNPRADYRYPHGAGMPK